MKKLYLIIFFLFFGFFSVTSAFAEAFTIKNYDIKLNVNKDKTVNIDELINVDFAFKRHGIFRKIPTTNNIIRADGTNEVLKAKIKNIKVDNKYTISNKLGNTFVQIGNPDYTVIGNQSYLIKYDYSIPKSKKLKDKDEFYFNIIGNDWDVDIEKVRFKIILPKHFDAGKLGFSIGTKYKSGYEKHQLRYSINNNEIEGETTIKLNPKEGLTVRLELPYDYFEYQNEFFQPFKVACASILLLLTSLSFLIWFKVGKDELVIPVVTFYPPGNLNSATIGSYNRENSKDDDIVSLIIYLASKGYILVNNSDSLNCTLKQLKEYDGTNKIEKELMEVLFNNGSEVSLEYLSKSKDYYRSCIKIKKEINDNCKKLYNSDSISIASKALPFCLVFISLFAMYASLMNYTPLTDDFWAIYIFPVIGVLTALSMYKTRPISTTFFSLPFILMPLISIYFELNFLNIDILALISVIMLLANMIFVIEMPKKNKAALKLLGKVQGFKKFLEVAEKHRIEILVKENPSYCFDVLPYAYVLGVSDVWIKNFAKYINTKFWVGPIDSYSFKDFSNACSNSLKPSVENGGISESSYSSGGGGGCSGGGFGGGGGGSW